MSLGPVAGITWRAAVRDRVLHLLGGCALVAIACSRAIGWVTPAEDVKVVTDLTLTTLSLFSVLVAVVLGARLLREDLDRRTLYTICAKDVSRGSVLLGKYLGLLAAFAAALALGAGIAAGYVAAMGGTIGVGFAAAIAGLFGQLAVLVAASLFFSTVASPLVASGATLAVFVVGNSVPILAEFREVWQPGLARDLAGVLYLTLPNLANCSFFAEASHDLPVDGPRTLLALGTAAAWSAVFLAGAWAVFRRKDL